jgi:hypothetical protein
MLALRTRLFLIFAAIVNAWPAAAMSCLHGIRLVEGTDIAASASATKLDSLLQSEEYSAYKKVLEEFKKDFSHREEMLDVFHENRGVAESNLERNAAKFVAGIESHQIKSKDAEAAMIDVFRDTFEGEGVAAFLMEDEEAVATLWGLAAGMENVAIATCPNADVTRRWLKYMDPKDVTLLFDGDVLVSATDKTRELLGPGVSNDAKALGFVNVAMVSGRDLETLQANGLIPGVGNIQKPLTIPKMMQVLRRARDRKPIRSGDSTPGGSSPTGSSP